MKKVLFYMLFVSTLFLAQKKQLQTLQKLDT